MMRKSLLIGLILSLMLVASAFSAIALAEEGETRYATVATEQGTLNLRAEARDNAKVLTKLGKGSVVTILDEQGDWTEIVYGKYTGFVKSSFLSVIDDLPYKTLNAGDKGDEVYEFKKALYKLEYLTSDEITIRFDQTMEDALLKLQLMNGLELNPKVVTPELQALVEWGKISKAKTGYVGTETDKDSGLTVSIFCWDSDGTLYEKDKAVKLKISFATQASGGVPPYDITVVKSLSGGGPASGDEVTSPFSHIWGQDTERVYVYATAVDAAGNTVTACAPFRYALPARYAK